MKFLMPKMFGWKHKKARNTILLRQAGKASVLRRQFPKAEILLREALLRARDVYGENHLKYADCMVDYAFYLLNVDGVMKSVQAYEKALSVSSLT